MIQVKEKKSLHFEDNQTGYHRSAVQILSGWVNGIPEKPFYHDSSILFVPDVTVYTGGIITAIYEVVYSHPMPAKKYGLIQYWCYLNVCDLTVYEISVDFILKQTGKPERIEVMECYIVNPFEYEPIQNNLLNPIN